MASIQQFLDYLLYEKKYSSHTVLAYQKDSETFAVFIQNQFEEEELREVNYSMIRSWIISLVDNGISNRSINRKISSLKTFYKFLLKIKEIETSPLVKHKSLKVDKKVQVPFSSKEVSEVIESFQQLIPMGDFGQPEDMGPLAVYLASDASRYMTGAALVIDGGYTLW